MQATSRTARSNTPSGTTSSRRPIGFGVWDTFGGRVGIMICNDRRWPESYRLMGLQGVELILCGYNTPLHYEPDPFAGPLQGFRNGLVMSAGAYQNGAFVVGVAKGGIEEGVDSLAESSIFAPSGELLAKAATNGDEVIVAECDLDWSAQYTARCSTSPSTVAPSSTARSPNHH